MDYSEWKELADKNFTKKSYNSWNKRSSSIEPVNITKVDIEEFMANSRLKFKIKFPEMSEYV